MSLLSRQQFRQQIRQQRKQLSNAEQQAHSHSLITQFASLAELSTSQHIALYLANDGELDPLPLIHWLWQQGKKTYLPVLHPFSSGHLLFLHYEAQTPMTRNKYGIAEPKLNKNLIIPVNQLDIICTPLVGFDNAGHRLGMGGGYYDRTLAGWFKDKSGAMPVGIAHDCQHVDTLPTQNWDVPLPKIVTPSRTWQWENHH